jgi:hypothetical protein
VGNFEIERNEKAHQQRGFNVKNQLEKPLD